MGIRKGDKVELKVNGDTVTGTIDKDPAPFPGGPVVGVTLDPEHAHLVPTGSLNAYEDEVTRRN